MLESPHARRLLQMMLSTQSGGAETFFEKLALAFAEAGVRQCLVMEPDGERERLFRGLSGVEVVPVAFGGLREWGARRALRAVFREFRPDVCLTWMNRASRRAPRGFCPVVGRLGGYYKLKHYRRCDHLVGITPDIVAHIKSGGWPEEAVSLIPNFGEVADAPGDSGETRESVRDALGAGSDRTVLLALGRLHGVKAHDTLIRALARQGPEVVLWIAGEGPLREELERLAESLGVADRVRFLGWRRDVGRLFAGCDISVFPSRYEPNGTVVMESWAQGKPLIASRAKGPEWLVDDGVNGLLFEIDAVDELAEKLDLLVGDAALRARLVENGLAKWREGFSKEAVVGRYLELFGRLEAREQS